MISVEAALFAIDFNIRFIYASSRYAYGYGRNGFYDDQIKLDSLGQQNDWQELNTCLIYGIEEISV